MLRLPAVLCSFVVVCILIAPYSALAEWRDVGKLSSLPGNIDVDNCDYRLALYPLLQVHNSSPSFDARYYELADVIDSTAAGNNTISMRFQANLLQMQYLAQSAFTEPVKTSPQLWFKNTFLGADRRKSAADFGIRVEIAVPTQSVCPPGQACSLNSVSLQSTGKAALEAVLPAVLSRLVARNVDKGESALRTSHFPLVSRIFTLQTNCGKFTGEPQ